MLRRTARTGRLLNWIGWLCFAAGVLAFIFLYFRYGATSIPKVRWRSRWGQPRRMTFRDPQGKFEIDHLSNWDVSAPFERFTRHRVGNLVRVDTVAIRRGKPIGILIILRYIAPARKSREEWLQEIRPGGSLAQEFGAKLRWRKPAELGSVPAEQVVAEDTVADTPYYLESWFLPAGAEAYRLTITAPGDQFHQVEPELRRMVASFRLTTKN
jgi:hypothetical protein